MERKHEPLDNTAMALGVATALGATAAGVYAAKRLGYMEVGHSANLRVGAVPLAGQVAEALEHANEGGFERLIAQGRGGKITAVYDGDGDKVSNPRIPAGTKRVIHNHPAIDPIMRGGGFSHQDIAFAGDRLPRGAFHAYSDEGSLYSMKMGRNAPKTPAAIDAVAQRHNDIRRAMMRDMLEGGADHYTARIAALSGASKVLKAEGIISYRELLRGAEADAVESLRPDIDRLVGEHARPAAMPKVASSIYAKMVKASAIGAPVAAASVATLAYKAARDQGKGQVRAGVEAAGAGAAVAAAPLAIGAAAAKLGRMSSIGAKAVSVAARAMLPVSIAGHAAAYAYSAAREGAGVGGTLKAAGWGAVNGVIPVDLGLAAYDSVRGSPGRTASNPATMSNVETRTRQNGAEFRQADARFREKWADQRSKVDATQPGDKRRGWAHPAVQQAAQAARGVENVTDWAQEAK